MAESPAKPSQGPLAVSLAAPAGDIPAIRLGASKNLKEINPKVLLVTSILSLLQLHGGRLAQHGPARGCPHHPTAAGGQGTPWAFVPPDREHSSSRFGGEAEGNPLWVSGMARELLFVPWMLHSQSLDEGPGPAQPHVLDVSSHPLPSPPCSPHWLLLFAISQAVPSQGQRAEGFV